MQNAEQILTLLAELWANQNGLKIQKVIIQKKEEEEQNEQGINGAEPI